MNAHDVHKCHGSLGATMRVPYILPRGRMVVQSKSTAVPWHGNANVRRRTPYRDDHSAAPSKSNTPPHVEYFRLIFGHHSKRHGHKLFLIRIGGNRHPTHVWFAYVRAITVMINDGVVQHKKNDRDAVPVLLQMFVTQLMQSVYMRY